MNELLKKVLLDIAEEIEAEAKEVAAKSDGPEPPAPVRHQPAA
jgi:hypothetical protein